MPLLHAYMHPCWHEGVVMGLQAPLSSQSAPNLVNMLSQGVQCWQDGLQQDREQFVLYWRQLSPYMNMHEAYVHA